MVSRLPAAVQTKSGSMGGSACFHPIHLIGREPRPNFSLPSLWKTSTQVRMAKPCATAVTGNRLGQTACLPGWMHCNRKVRTGLPSTRPAGTKNEWSSTWGSAGFLIFCPCIASLGNGAMGRRVRSNDRCFPAMFSRASAGLNGRES